MAQQHGAPGPITMGYAAKHPAKAIRRMQLIETRAQEVDERLRLLRNEWTALHDVLMESEDGRKEWNEYCAANGLAPDYKFHDALC